MPGDDMDWLYRSNDPSGGDPERTRALPTAGAQPPANPTPAPATGRRRASFGDPGTPAHTPTARPPAAGSPQRTRAMSTSDIAAAGASAPTAGSAGRGTPPAPPATPRTRKPRRPGRTAARALIALVLVWLAFLIGTPIHAWSSTNKVDVIPTGQRPPDQPGTTWLIVGSDSREGLDEQERKKLGTGDIQGQRTDTMMILHVPPSGRPVLVSLPRDSYVTLPGRGRNKLNAAYAYGGPKLLVHTVEQNTGLRIDHYAEIGFGGFVNVIDALGGIQMCPKTAIKDKFSHLDIPAGCQEMDGVTALGYVRMRYADPTGDLGRMNRQREMVAAVAKKSASPMTVINPLRWWGLNVGAAQSVKTDRDTGVLATMGLISPLLKVGSGEGLTLMVPISNPNATTAAGSSMLWNTAKAKEMFDEMARGDTSRLDRFVIR